MKTSKDSRAVHRTAEYKTAQSAKMKAWWRRKRRQDTALTERMSGPLKFVDDDSVTAMVNILRKLMSQGELALFLANKAHAIVREANGTGKEE